MVKKYLYPAVKVKPRCESFAFTAGAKPRCESLVSIAGAKPRSVVVASTVGAKPCSEVITSTVGAKPCSVAFRLYCGDVEGRFISCKSLKSEMNFAQFNLTDKQNGIYFLNVNTSTGESMKYKVVLVK